MFNLKRVEVTKCFPYSTEITISKKTEDRRATLAQPGITSHLLKDNKISELVLNSDNGTRKYSYGFM